ncbi:hypothetical protein C1I95_20405 [Micromonospora craterilacus]|uniref:Uncharacterized protein n=1 Tax=Micromonospora craterilacus TaxID=1655439 RepID=A0A2W2DSV2_9ACTN|nr:hypothetical protein [Micromonospora craterilacus]PZG15072.1 hypothetical protein C1I95_20405 [Micromonospora craterilacus]
MPTQPTAKQAGPPPLDLDAILARHAATSPGRWDHRGDAEVRGIPGVHEAVVTDQPGDAGDVIALTGRVGEYPRSCADAVFIGHAHTDIPAMAAEIRRLYSRLAKVETAADRLVDQLREEGSDWSDEVRDAVTELTTALAPFRLAGGR